MIQMKKAVLSLLFLLGISAAAFAGDFNLGAQFYGWNSNYVAPANFSGYEIWAPISLRFSLAEGINVYSQSEFGNAGYTDSLSGTASTTYLTGFSDTLAGGEFNFKSFGVPSILNIGFYIPTSDPTWEARQVASNIPTEFVNSRYRGRGFGVSGMYGLSFPAGSAEVGVAGGYLTSGSYNDNLNMGPADNLSLGDSIFLALNHLQKFSENQRQVFRLSGFVFLPTSRNGVNIIQMGPNFNASYSWVNPKGLSFDLGAQAYLPAQRMINGALAAEPKNSYGPRFYLNPSYSFGELALAGQVKYVLANGYGLTEAFHDGGGIMLGIGPSVKLKLDEGSALNLSLFFDSITAQDAGVDAAGARTNVNYTLWTFGTSYEVRF